MAVSKKTQKGFTLVELLVTISIFVILTGVVLFNQNKFNSTILLTNLAYDTALTIRQAQTYGINIKEFVTPGNTSEFKPYGVYFTYDEKTSFILFVDIDEDGFYDSGSDGLVNRYSIKRGNYISDICVQSGAGTCLPSSISELNIVFKRPNPDALIRTNNTDSNLYDKAIITLGNPDGSTRNVVVQANGLIEIVNQ